MSRQDDVDARNVERGIRLDLAVAVCALLISTLAAGASWWQARVLVKQTAILQEQLGAQVWPYVSNTVEVSGDTVRILIRNDGLGPAVVNSFSIAVDGVPERSYLDVVHAMLGPHLVARSPVGDKIQLRMQSGSPGVVLRPSQSSSSDEVLGFDVVSRHFSSQVLRASRRLSFDICYCAIVPGKCWRSMPVKYSTPQAVSSCASDPHDLLHASAIDELTSHDL